MILLLFLFLRGLQGYTLSECLIYMHASNWVLFSYFVLVLTLQNMKFIFSLSSSDLSIKTNCYPSTIEMVEWNCSIHHVTKFWNVHLLNGDLIELQSVLFKF